MQPAPDSEVKPLASNLLSAVGLAPSADGDVPDVPGDSPLLLAGLAAFRRQTQQSLVGDEASALKVADPSQSSLMLAAAVANSAPVVPVQPVGVPDPVSGVVSGTVVASDPDGNVLSYTVTGASVLGPSEWATAKGTVRLNSATGAYTYTPTQDARLAAGATDAADVDSFSVVVSDGQQSTTAPVSVYVLPSRFAQSSVAVGNTPSAMAVSPVANDPRMYVANTGSGTVSVINTATGQRIDANSSSSSMDISVGSSPSALAVSADGKRLYVANTGSGTVSVIDTTTYTRIDANSSTLSKDISVGSSPSALAISADGKRLYVANTGSNTVSVIDTSSYKVIDTDTNALGVNSIAVGSSPSALVLNGTRLYVANRGSNTVSVIDTAANKVIDTDTNALGVNSIAVGSSPSALVLNGTRLYVANRGSNTVSVIDTATNKVIDTDTNAAGINSIAVGSSPGGLALAGGRLYVVNTGSGTVSVINVATNQRIDVDPAAASMDIRVGSSPSAVAAGPNGTVYVTDAVDRTVRMLTIARGNTAPVSTAPPTVDAVNLSNGAVSGLVNITDLDGDALTYSVVVSPTKGSLTFDPATGSYTYTPTQAARDAAVQTPATDTFTIRVQDQFGAYKDTTPIAVTVSPTPTVPSIPVTSLTSIRVGDSPIGMTVAGSRLYVVNSGSNTLSIIDTTDNRVLGTIPVTSYPSAVAATEDGSRVYIGYYDTVAAVDINTTTNQVTGVTNIAIPDLCATNECYGSAGGLADVVVSPDGRFVYAARQYAFDNGNPSAISYIDPVTKTVISTGMSYGVVDMEFATDGTTRVYMADGGYHAILMEDAVTGEFRDMWFNGIDGFWPVARTVSMNPAGTRVYAVAVPSPWDYSGNKVVVYDTDRSSPTYNTHVATITVPDGAQYVEFSADNTRAYVVHNGGKSVTVIDTATNTVIGSISSSQIGGDYAALSIGPDGTLYFSNYANDTVYAVTVGSTTATSAAPQRMMAAPSQSSSMLAAADTGPAQLMTLAAAVNTAPSASPTAGLPETVNGVVAGSLNAVDAENNSMTYVVQTKSAGSDVKVDSAGNFTYTPSVVQRLQAATTSGLDTDTFTVRVSDGQTFTDVPVTVVIRPGQLAGGTSIGVGTHPSGIAVNADGSWAYATNQDAKTLSVIDTSTGAVLSTITLPSAPTAVVVNPVAGQNRAYVAMTSGVAVFDTSANKLVDLNTTSSTLDVIKVGSSPSALAINPAGTRLYVSNGGSNTVSVVDLTTNKEITKVTVGLQPSGLAVSPDGTRVYALSKFGDKVTVINAANNQVLGSTAVGKSPRNVVVSPNGQQLYVTNYGSNTVTVLNSTAAAPVFNKTITVGAQPEGIAIAKDGALVYVANGNDTVSVIDAKTNTVIGSAIPIASPANTGAHTIALSGNTILITDYADNSLRVLNVARAQTTPQANGQPTVDTPDSTTGAVTGDLKIIDTDGDALSYTVTDTPDKGVLTVNPNGTYLYTPTPAARDAAAVTPATDTFTVRVSDTLGGYKDTSVTVTIAPKALPPNHEPSASPTGWGSADLATGVITGIMNGSDPDGDRLTYAVWEQSRVGVTTVNPATGEFTVIPTLMARLQADTTAGYDYVGINVSVSDGRATVNHSMLGPLVPARLQVGSPVSVGQDPTGVAVSGDRVFVVNQLDKTLSVIDGTAGNTTIPLGATPSAVVVSPDASRAYVTLLGSTGNVAVVDTSSGQIVKNITVGANPAALAMTADGRRVYVTNGGSNTLSVIDTNPASATYNTEISRITVGAQPSGIAVTPDGRWLYVTMPASDSVAVVDTVTNAVTTIGVGDSPRGVAVTPDGKQAYVVNYDGTVSVVSPGYTYPVSQIAVGPQPTSVAISRDGTAFVTNGNDTVSLIDTRSQSVFATITLSPNTATGPHYVAVNANGTRIYVTDTNDDLLRVLAVNRGNTAPLRGSYYPPSYGGDPSTVGTADRATGAVNGAAYFVDPEGDALTYTASVPANGSVVVNPTTGTFVYTPTQAARDLALATEQNETDTFTITASDGQASTPTTITVPIGATNNLAPRWIDYSQNYDPVSKKTTGTINATDEDSGDILRYYLVDSGWSGTATLTAAGNFTYTPSYTGPGGYPNYDIITVAITDGHYTTYGYIYVDSYTEYCGEACAL